MKEYNGRKDYLESTGGERLGSDGTEHKPRSSTNQTNHQQQGNDTIIPLHTIMGSILEEGYQRTAGLASSYQDDHFIEKVAMSRMSKF